MTVGHAQKIWSIFYKHLWCHGALSDPGLCPVDAIMRDITVNELSRHQIDKTARQLKTAINGVAWTSMSRGSYFDFLRADIYCAKKLGVTVSEWELDRFSGGRSNSLSAPVSVLKQNFLVHDRWAAKPGSSADIILKGAYDDMWNSSYLSGARGYGPSQTESQRRAVREFVENWLITNLESCVNNSNYGTMTFAVLEVDRLLRATKKQFAWL